MMKRRLKCFFVKRSVGRKAPVAAPPNKRLKLTPPVVRGRIAFVKTKFGRRSLAAIR
jgi:hypothetical protein